MTKKLFLTAALAVATCGLEAAAPAVTAAPAAPAVTAAPAVEAAPAASTDKKDSERGIFGTMYDYSYGALAKTVGNNPEIAIPVLLVSGVALKYAYDYAVEAYATDEEDNLDVA